MKKIIFVCLLGQSVYADPSLLHLMKRIPALDMLPIASDDYLDYDLLRVKEYISFKSGLKEISSDSYKILKTYGSAIEDGVTSSKLIIEGHTDSVGTDEDNEKLAYDRANEVKQFLISFYNISPNRLIVKAYGERRPLETNKTKYGRMVNRRVEFVRIE